MKSDKLFLAWNCSDCVKVKSKVQEVMFNDQEGKHGQTLTAIHTFSNDGTRDILDIFNLDDKTAPVLLTYNEKILDKPEEIIEYLSEEFKI
jgi:hypothetical protein